MKEYFCPTPTGLGLRREWVAFCTSGSAATAVGKATIAIGITSAIIKTIAANFVLVSFFFPFYYINRLIG